jgi:hypothetical protein
MSIEKRGVVDENTPQQGCGGHCGCKNKPAPNEKAAADAQEAHLTTRLSDAATEAFQKK